jgi:hypothetical protein
MTIEDAYFVGIHRYMFRCGIPAKIIGVSIITHENTAPKLCYHVEYSDDVTDWKAIADTGNYKIISFKDILVENIPKVTE